MTGFYFDFEENDIILTNSGSFGTSDIDSQCCALIAVSQICRLTAPTVGEQLATKIFLQRPDRVKLLITKAERAVKRDGAREVKITLDENQQLQFYANYGNL